MRDSDVVADEVYWLRPSGLRPLYPLGFTNVFTLDGARYQLRQPVLEPVSLPGGAVLLRAYVQPGYTYIIEASEDLGIW